MLYPIFFTIMHIKNIIKDLKEKNLIIDRENFMRYFNKGRIKFFWNNIPGNKDLEEFEIFVKAANTIFPNNWDFITDVVKELSGNKIKFYYLIKGIRIFIPTAVIKNEDGLEYEIKELYVDTHFTTRYKGLGIGKVGAFRTSFLDVEIEKGFIHSHTPHTFGDDIRSLISREVCRGSSTLGIACGKIDNNNILFEDAINLFVSILAFSQQESIAGGPYRRIKEMIEFKNNREDFLKTTSPGTSYSYVRDSIYPIFRNYIITKNLRLPLVFTNGELRFKDNTQIKNYLIEFIENNLEFTHKKKLLSYCVNSTYYEYFDKKDLLEVLEKETVKKEDGESYQEEIIEPSELKYFRGKQLIIKKFVKKDKSIDKNLIKSLTLDLKVDVEFYIKNFLLNECKKNIIRKARENRYKN